VVTLCEVCWDKPAAYVCPVCGRSVCEYDYVRESNRCLICEEAICSICGKHLAIGYCGVCGRLGCDDCLVQIDNVRRVCRDCLVRLGRERVLRVLRLRPRPVSSLILSNIIIK